MATTPPHETDKGSVAASMEGQEPAPARTTLQQDDEEEPPTACCSKRSWRDSWWKSPWVVFLLFLYIFALPWEYVAIVDRYFIRRAFDEALIGLDTTMARKIFMVAHMCFGGITMILGPLQLTPYIKHRFPSYHRCAGRVYVVCSLLCAFCGLIFICLKGFVLVGGISMGLSFAAAGVWFGVTAYMTYHAAARQQDYDNHWNWVIRSYAQVLAPMLYRYFYLAAEALGWISLDNVAGPEFCDVDTETCPMYDRTFDAIHAWTYWLFPLVIAELIVYAAPRSTSSKKDIATSPNKNTEEDEEQPSEQPPKSVTDTDEVSSSSSSHVAINALGIGLAICTIGCTFLILLSN